MKRLTIGLAALLLGLAAMACGNSNKVGSDSLVNFQDEAQNRLGAATATPRVTQAAASSATAAPKGAITQATPKPAERAAITVAINSDTGNTKGSFDPSVARVYAGSEVLWTNKDSVARSIVSDTDAFKSGPIAPGASWSYKFTTAGKFNYHDGTRPYAVAIVEVLPT